MRLRLVWWNAQDFAHHDPARVGELRWPSSAAEFNAKVDLVAAVLADYTREEPVVIALGETTKIAAEALRDRLLPTYSVASLDLLPRADFHVALIYPPESHYSIQQPFAAHYVPRGTRPMAVLDVLWKAERVRIMAGHWTARFAEASEKTRSDTARDLARYIFDFLDVADPNENKHIVVLGDLNEEPHGLLESDLFAQRERARAQRRHWTDKDVKRRYLYNASWRMLGERVALLESPFDSAGTYYWRDENEWRTFDHIIVDGSLVSSSYPQLDEKATGVVVHPKLFKSGRFPEKFWWDGRAPAGGVSDHLPLTSVLHFEAST